MTTMQVFWDIYLKVLFWHLWCVHFQDTLTLYVDNNSLKLLLTKDSLLQSRQMQQPRNRYEFVKFCEKHPSIWMRCFIYLTCKKTDAPVEFKIDKKKPSDVSQITLTAMWLLLQITLWEGYFDPKWRFFNVKICLLFNFQVIIIFPLLWNVKKKQFKNSKNGWFWPPIKNQINIFHNFSWLVFSSNLIKFQPPLHDFHMSFVIMSKNKQFSVMGI